MKNLKTIATFVIAALMLSAVAGIVVTAIPEPAGDNSSQIDAVMQGTTALIDSNQILARAKDESSLVGIGTVEKVDFELLEDRPGHIVTNARILMETPLTGNIESNETVTVRYDGGTIGNTTMALFISWAIGPQDTVQLPSMLKLDIGMRILFFAQQKDEYMQLATYVPFSTENTKPG